MKLAELIDTHQKSLAALEKRVAATPSAELAAKLGKEALAAQAERIEQRIARLDRQRAAMLARLDSTLEAEHAALSDIRRMAETVPFMSRPRAANPPTKRETVPKKKLSTKAGGAKKTVRAKNKVRAGKSVAANKAVRAKKNVRVKPARPR